MMRADRATVDADVVDHGLCMMILSCDIQGEVDQGYELSGERDDSARRR